MVSFTGFSVVVACWLVFLLYWLVSAFFVKKSMTGRNWTFQVLWRVALVVAVILFVRADKAGALATATSLLTSGFSFVHIGSTVTVLGLVVAVWARFALGRNWSSYVTYKEEHELVTSGPYRLVRHPIYAGMILMLVGTFLCYGSLLLAAILLVAAIGFLWRIGREEAIMLKLFGEKYADYRKRTKRLIPFIY